jgi:UDP-N-acetylglucosamine--N-acetylmuramyl-(pentapeptide) pyrophosphoryl-undecaprenol N-acetylglucosamine transferase
MSKIVIMAGGTGGHVFPGLAVAEILASKGWSIDWFGTAEKMEAQLVPKHGFNIHFIDIAGLRNKGWLRKLTMPVVLFKALLQARKKLKQLRPDVVLGMGGYASGPGGLAAYTLGIPLVVHEQNAVFGLTNRYLAKVADKVLCGFDVSLNKARSKAPSNTIFVGNPIRKGFAHIPAITSHQSENTNILIVGGSLGALALNEIVPSILLDLRKQHAISIWHQTGKDKLAPVELAYKDQDDVITTEFIEDVESAYAWADIVICRAGALTVSEVSSAGRVAVFVPLPIAVDDHQTQNAENLARQNAAVLIRQSELKQNLADTLGRLLNDKVGVQEMGAKAKQLSLSDAGDAVAEHCISLVSAHKDSQNGH